MAQFKIIRQGGKKWAVPSFEREDLDTDQMEMLEFLRDRKETDNRWIGVNWPQFRDSPVALEELIRMEISLDYGELLPENLEMHRTNGRVEYKFNEVIYETDARIRR